MNEIVPAFEVSLFEPTFSSAIDYIELGIDAIIENETIKGIPIVNTIVGIGKTVYNLRERNLLEQTLCFIKEFRISQNWIGGSMPSTAVYVPPPHTEVAECLTDFEKFINNEKIDTPDLVKIAILHYQFESIHPFLDGNGRIGRLLIPLYIQSKGMLDKSCLYISDYIERNKNTYYDLLTRVRTHNDMMSWIKFFLEAVIETSKTAKEKFRKVVELTMEMDKLIVNLPIKSDNAKKVIDVLYNEPVINRKKLCDLTKIKEGTIKNAINCLLENNIIVETTGYSRNQIFTFQKYTDLFLK